MCNPDGEYKDFVIKKFKYWRVELNCQQTYLGWCLVILNRHLEDLIDITKEEQAELFEVSKKVRDAIKESFHPDMFNYASLGNQTAHLHLRIIPRYSKPVKFGNIEFKDERWGKNYSPYNKNFKIPKEVETKIRDTIKEKLSSI